MAEPWLLSRKCALRRADNDGRSIIAAGLEPLSSASNGSSGSPASWSLTTCASPSGSPTRSCFFIRATPVSSVPQRFPGLYRREYPAVSHPGCLRDSRSFGQPTGPERSNPNDCKIETIGPHRSRFNGVWEHKGKSLARLELRSRIDNGDAGIVATDISVASPPLDWRENTAPRLPGLVAATLTIGLLPSRLHIYRPFLFGFLACPNRPASSSAGSIWLFRAYTPAAFSNPAGDRAGNQARFARSRFLHLGARWEKRPHLSLL